MPNPTRSADTRTPAPKQGSTLPGGLAAPRPGSKQARIIALMRRKRGATLTEMAEATGWLPHNTRAALTRLGGRGYRFDKRKSGKGESVFRITADPGPVTGRLG